MPGIWTSWNQFLKWESELRSSVHLCNLSNNKNVNHSFILWCIARQAAGSRSKKGVRRTQRKDHLARRPQDLFLNLPRLMRKMWRSWIKTREGLLDQFHLSQAPHLGGEVPPKKNNLSRVSISLIYWLRSMNPQKQNYYTPSSLPTHWCQNMNKYLPSCKLTCRLLSCNVPTSSAAAQPAPMLAHAPPMTHYAPWATRAIFRAQTHPMLHNVPYPHQWAPLPYSCHLPQMEPTRSPLTSTFGHPGSQFGLMERSTMAHKILARMLRLEMWPLLDVPLFQNPDRRNLAFSSCDYFLLCSSRRYCFLIFMILIRKFVDVWLTANSTKFSLFFDKETSIFCYPNKCFIERLRTVCILMYFIYGCWSLKFKIC